MLRVIHQKKKKKKKKKIMHIVYCTISLLLVVLAITFLYHHILVVGPILDAFLLARNAKVAATFLTLFPFKDFDSFKLSALK